MKNIVSVSIGSSARDHEAQAEIFGEKFCIKRIGTDGDVDKAADIIKSLDGKADAIGLGGLDAYLYSKNVRYVLEDGRRLLEAAKITPVVDGSGLKNTLERETIKFLVADGAIPIKNKKVLMVSAMDRFGMAEALEEAGANVVYGDLIFAVGIDKPLCSLDELSHYASKLLPQLSRLPISIIYPTGKKQRDIVPDKLTAPYYEEADIIAGDFHYVRKHMPDDLSGKIIITNTVTAKNIEEMKERNVAYLVTSTPEFSGRSFGTNVMEAMLISILGKKWNDVVPSDYLELISKLGFKPRIERLS